MDEERFGMTVLATSMTPTLKTTVRAVRRFHLESTQLSRGTLLPVLHGVVEFVWIVHDEMTSSRAIGG